MPSGDQSRTLECWFKITGNAASDQPLCGMGYDTGTGSIFSLMYRAAGSTLSLDAKGMAQSFAWAYDSNWHHLVAAYTEWLGIAESGRYLDGALQTHDGGDRTLRDAILTYFDVQHNPAYSFNDLTGMVDEFRISSASRSPGWIVTEYNNQNLPATLRNRSAGVADFRTGPRSRPGVRAARRELQLDAAGDHQHDHKGRLHSLHHGRIDSQLDRGNGL